MEADCIRAETSFADKMIDKVVDKAVAVTGVSLLDSVIAEKDIPISDDKDKSKSKTHEHHFLGMLDKVINKLTGKPPRCQAGKALKLSKTCVPDSMANLIMARLF